MGKTEALVLDIGSIAERVHDLASRHKVALLADDNTIEQCYPLIDDEQVDVLLVPIGEEAKSLEVVQFLWNSLADLGYTRYDYLITLGGGAVSDVGGFVASTYMRGIRLIHIPTTLLGMIDASIGGKTAIDYGGVKNLVGSFYEPNEVWVSLTFLETLPKQEVLSGEGELVKYGLLDGDELYQETLDLEVIAPDLIAKVIQYKLDVVAADLRDEGGRVVLNLGHSTAHSLEALKISRGEVLPHGIAVMAGLIVALYISYKWYGLEEQVLSKLIRVAKDRFPRVAFSCDDYEEMWQFALKDKKNSGGAELTMVLLSEVGCPMTEQVTRKQWEEALDFYRDFMF